MSEKKSYNVYLETSVADDAKELDEFESFSSMVETLVSAYLRGDIDVAENSVDHSVDRSEHQELKSLEERITLVEDRLDAFENEGQETLDTHTDAIQVLQERMDGLEEYVPE